ncbi:DegT/DnrJ/EryC1/StrS family aminotransferase [Streptomyces pseudovenezuelae]|uniref:DegT/DnrJ/EryC1/StrS family aminotransferase n=1 Tax=Streptomyces pseudovenezuelae TaxID=67350 RepID=UPI002E80DC73|nr:DegT/DnrJ/EryC1/StrS family aminotransferase [Streptomyces pseudovenezuelae]WUA94392.1 DegT/DnrJ/EryC1/StrS family aminotransferase [Streptomyces pseudovenezuelae]
MHASRSAEPYTPTAQTEEDVVTSPSRPHVRRNASPYLFGGEAAAVAQVLESGQYGHSDVTEEFERRVADFLGVPEVVAVVSGTAALHLALLAAGAGPGDEVIVPSMTFCATVQAILAAGAIPVFVDVAPATLCVTDQLVTDAVTERTRAVLPVLFGGRAIDFSRIRTELTARGVVIVEDAAHAFGSRHGARKVGATGDLSCFSFGPIKNLTCGQGGAVIPRTPQEAETIRLLRTLGIRQSQADRIRSTNYSVDRIGQRYTMSALNAAIGLAQLSRFEEIEAARPQLWRTYRDALAGTDGVALVDLDIEHTVPFNCVVRVPNREAVFADMQARGIGVGVHYPPNHLQQAFAAWHRPLPVTEQVAEEIMSLPFHPAMTEQDVSHVVDALRKAVTR